MKKLLLLIVGLTMFCLQINAQVSTAFNNVGTYSGEYVGWDGSMTNPLVIKHIGNYDMEFYTNNAQRMTLKNTGELGIGTALLSKIHPAVGDEATTKENRNSSNDEFVEKVATINVKRTVKAILERSPILKEMIESGTLGIAGGNYDVSSGEVEFYDDATIIK